MSLNLQIPEPSALGAGLNTEGREISQVRISQCLGDISVVESPSFQCQVSLCSERCGVCVVGCVLRGVGRGVWGVGRGVCVVECVLWGVCCGVWGVGVLCLKHH